MIDCGLLILRGWLGHGRFFGPWPALGRYCSAELSIMTKTRLADVSVGNRSAMRGFTLRVSAAPLAKPVHVETLAGWGESRRRSNPRNYFPGEAMF